MSDSYWKDNSVEATETEKSSDTSSSNQHRPERDTTSSSSHAQTNYSGGYAHVQDDDEEKAEQEKAEAKRKSDDDECERQYWEDRANEEEARRHKLRREARQAQEKAVKDKEKELEENVAGQEVAIISKPIAISSSTLIGGLLRYLGWSEPTPSVAEDDAPSNSKKKRETCVCEEIKAIFAAAYARNNKELQQLAIIFADIDCDDACDSANHSNANEGKKLNSRMNVSFSVANGAHAGKVAGTFVYNNLAAVLALPKSTDSKNLSVMTFDQFKNLQKQLRDQIQKKNNEQAAMSRDETLFEDLQYAVERMLQAGLLQMPSHDVLISMHNGYPGNSTARVMTIIDNSSGNNTVQQFVIPANPRIAPYPVPKTDAERKRYEAIEENHAKAEKQHAAKIEKEKKEQAAQAKAAQKQDNNQNSSFITKTLDYLLCRTPQKQTSANPLKTTIQSPQPPTVLVHPVPPIEKPKQDGCGGKKNETPTPTSTAHGPQPKPSQELPGCDKSTKTPAEIADQAIMHADKSKDGETWVGKDGKTRNVGDLSDVDVQYPNNIKHLFDDRPGHLPDTPKNREQIIDLVKDAKNFATQDRHGKLWFGKTLPNGKQLWAHVINDTITNCGLNEIPVKCNPDSGFSRPNKPRQ